jgi:hypothetical protein
MLSSPKYEEQLGVLEERLPRAHALTPELMSDVIAKVCTQATHKAKVNQLTEAGAWIDATLARVGLELPSWKLRRLVHEDGKWLCSLSKQPNLLVALDDTADARLTRRPSASRKIA